MYRVKDGTVLVKNSLREPLFARVYRDNSGCLPSVATTKVTTYGDYAVLFDVYCTFAERCITTLNPRAER